jgi:predicted lysophospholipase L1 biosynthesis ABC-type transport system permease subunit
MIPEIPELYEAEDRTPVSHQHEIHFPLFYFEIILGLVILSVVGWYTYQTLQLPEPYNPVDIGPGGFPLLLSAGTLFALVLYLLDSILRYKRQQQVVMVTIGRPAYVLAACMTLIGQAVLFETMGAFVCVAVFSLIAMLVAGERRLIHIIGVSVGVTAGIYLVFAVALDVYFQ